MAGIQRLVGLPVADDACRIEIRLRQQVRRIGGQRIAQARDVPPAIRGARRR